MDITTMGERIRELRRNAGMTQDELGNKIGVSAQAVSNWERGSVPDTELIPRIADCFGVSTDALFGREYENYDVYSLMAKHIVAAFESIIDVLDFRNIDRRRGAFFAFGFKNIAVESVIQKITPLIYIILFDLGIYARFDIFKKRESFFTELIIHNIEPFGFL
jgi:transcriptional regulator with XRE-family HTH domain